MEAFSALQALFAGNSPVTGEFPSQRPVTRSFDVFFDLRLNKRFSKQSWGRWFETPSRSLWRHCNDNLVLFLGFYALTRRSSPRWEGTSSSILYSPMLDLTDNSCLEFGANLISEVVFRVGLLGAQNITIWENPSGGHSGDNKVLYKEGWLHFGYE